MSMVQRCWEWVGRRLSAMRILRRKRTGRLEIATMLAKFYTRPTRLKDLGTVALSSLIASYHQRKLLRESWRLAQAKIKSN